MRKPRDKRPELERRQAMSARPVLNRLITIEESRDGFIVLNIPAKRTTMVRWLARAFRLPPYKRIELDELGSFVVELCDGRHSVRDMVDGFADHFQLDRREAELSLINFLKTLVRKGILVMVLPDEEHAAG